ncbi:kinase-like protein [Pilatotrama ljubarskyi]|nr:kinase-like protein [Pilatotrama ljubarskyi]
MEPDSEQRPEDQDMSTVAESQPLGTSQSTQQPTQPTQHASQTDYVVDPLAWGKLIPCNPADLETIVFQRWKRRYQIGRKPQEAYRNDVVLNGLSISSKHCVIEWDGVEGPVPAIKVTDLKSSNGTYINGENIERYKLLRDGNEIAFGTCASQQTVDGKLKEFRYIYRHEAYRRPTHGLYRFYDLQDELGSGAFATVVKALHREDGNWYAVKMIDPKKLRADWIQAIAEGAPLDDITREISILQRLEHRNVCRLKEFFVEGNSLSLVLEWVPGGDLLHYLLRRYADTDENMTEQEAQYFTYQICDAVAYVHRQGIAHRDLKPENVLLTKDVPPVVKVADFGVAKAIDGQTLLKTMVGTPAYWAPEVVARGAEGYSLLVDSWSVGVMVFSMLTMKTPFIQHSEDRVETWVANRSVEWSALYERRISQEGEDFIRSLLENDPQQRMSMADACLHPWLTAQAMQRLNVPSHTPHASQSSQNSYSALDISPMTTQSDNMSMYYGAGDDTATERGTPRPTVAASSQGPRFTAAYLSRWDSVPGLQPRAEETWQPGSCQQEAPQSEQAQDMEEDAPTPEAEPGRTRAAKRKASLAFTSSFDSIYTVTPRAGSPGGGAQTAEARASPSARRGKRQRTEADSLSPISDEEP